MNITRNINNYLYDNPVIPGDVLWWGYGYPREIFYLIDFFNIKDNKYIVSTYGRVFSLTDKRELKGTRKYYKNYYVLEVNLRTNDNGSKKCLIDKLVATAFIPRTEEDILYNRNFINHKNSLFWDNTVWNLEWCIKDMRDIFKGPSLFSSLNNSEGPTIHYGDNHSRCRITNEQVRIICQALEKGYDYKTCCELAGLEYNQHNYKIVSNIKYSRRRTDISSQYNINNTINNPSQSYDSYQDIIVDLLIQGNTIKQVYDIIKDSIPYKNQNETDKQHYDRVRMKISNIRKQLEFEGIL